MEVKEYLQVLVIKTFLPSDLVMLVSQPSLFWLFANIDCDFIFQMDTDIYKIVVTRVTVRSW